MAGVQLKKVDADEAGMRLDRWFKVHFPGLGFGPLQKLLRSGQIRVDGGRVKSDTRLQPGQQVRIPPIAADRKSGPVTARTMRGEEDDFADVIERWCPSGSMRDDTYLDDKLTPWMRRALCLASDV